MERLKQLRVEKGLSQARLAARAELDPSTVNQIERGAREASLGALRKLADALGVSLYELLEEEAPKAPAPPPDTEQGRRSPVLTEAVISTVDKWINIVSDPATNDWKRFGIADAAAALGDSIEDTIEHADGVSWDSLTAREQHKIMHIMEKLTEVFQRANQRIKDENLEEEFNQRREKIREWTQRISA